MRAGETCWEPGGDVIHYQDGNNLTDAETRFVVTVFGVPGQPMLIPVSRGTRGAPASSCSATLFRRYARGWIDDYTRR